jgi:hypothetical protein
MARGSRTSNHEPVDGMSGHESTDFTSEFLQRCHALSSGDSDLTVYGWNSEVANGGRSPSLLR